jgi:hypothetical protein
MTTRAGVVRIAQPGDYLGGRSSHNIVNRLTAGEVGGIQIEQSLSAREGTGRPSPTRSPACTAPSLRDHPGERQPLGGWHPLTKTRSWCTDKGEDKTTKVGST